MTEHYQHITDPPSIRNRSASNERVVATGSAAGRFIFTKWAPLVLLERPREGVTMDRIHFEGGTVGVEVR